MYAFHHADAGAWFAAVFGGASWDEHLGKHNPWSLQVKQDFKQLEPIESFSEIAKVASADPLHLLNDRDMCGHFCSLDFSIIGVHFIETCTSALASTKIKQNGTELDFDPLFTCPFKNEDGSVCNYSAKLQSSVVHHAVKKQCV